MKTTVLMCLAVALLALGSCDFHHIKITTNNDTPTQVHEAGEVTTMNPFATIEVAGPFNVIYEQGEDYTVRVDGTAEQVEKMTIYVEDEELCLDVSGYHWPEEKDFFKGVRIFVTSPSAKELNISGTGTLTAPKALTAEDMNLQVAGNGGITIAEMKCNNLNINIAGNGDVTTGPIQANSISNIIAGRGNIDLAGVVCKKVDNTIAGAGDITLNCIDVTEVNSSIAGSGDIILHGKVDSHKEEIAGSGKVKLDE